MPSVPLFFGLIFVMDFALFHWLVIEKLIVICSGIVGGFFILTKRSLGYYLLKIEVMVIFFSVVQRFVAFYPDFNAMPDGTQMLMGYELSMAVIIVSILLINKKSNPNFASPK